MSAEGVVVIAEAMNGAPRKKPVEEVVMEIGTDLIAEVERDGGVNTVGEGTVDLRIAVLEVVKGVI